MLLVDGGISSSNSLGVEEDSVLVMALAEAVVTATITISLGTSLKLVYPLGSR